MTYRHHLADGTGVAGATDIIAAFIPGFQASDFHKQRGQARHAWLAHALKGGSLDGCHPDLLGWVNSGLLWVKQERVEVLQVEKAYVNEALRFGATLDLLCRWGGKAAVVDWKPDAIPASGAIQTALQVISMGQGIDFRRACVALQKEGSVARVQEYTDNVDFADALALIGAYQVSIKYGVSRE